jgi:hypothetical protein
MSERLPAHVEVAGLIRAVDAAGGFGMVLAKGERDAGTLLVVCTHNGRDQRAWERMPQRDGTRGWAIARREEEEGEPGAFAEYLERRRQQDPDLWIVELDIPHAERFIEGLGTRD